MRKQLLIIVFATVLAYLNIFNNQLAVDDKVFVGKYHPNVVEAFLGAVPPGHEGVYRPIRGLFYTIFNQLWGANPIGYHLHSLLVHLAATILVYGVIREIRAIGKKRNMIAFVAGLLFGLHPVHTESITYIASAMDSIGIVFFLAAFYLYLTRSRNKFGMTISVIFAALAFFTTEMTLTLPLLILLYEVVINTPIVIPAKAGIYTNRSWIPSFEGMTKGVKGMTKKIWPYFALAGIYVFVRFFALGIVSRGPYLANSFYLTMLTMTKVLLHYLWVLIWPVNLANNHIISPGIEAFVYRNYQTAAIAGQSILDPEILFSITIIIIIIFIIVIARKNHPLVSFAIGWFFISLLPVMELVPQGSMFNERMLYIPSVGFVLVAGWAFYNIYNRYNHYKYYILVGLLVVAMLYGVRTALRNADWRNDVTLWQADVRLSPDQNAYARFALGNAYNDRKEYQKAVDEYAKSVEINPGFAVGWASLGRTYADMGKVPEAIANYKQALTIDPNFWEVKNNLNNIYNRL